jgi:uncharacterized protein YqgC (DUF456 family)
MLQDKVIKMHAIICWNGVVLPCLPTISRITKALIVYIPNFESNAPVKAKDIGMLKA